MPNKETNDRRISPKAPRHLRVAVWIGLSDKKCMEKLRGLDASDHVAEGILFRRYPLPGLTKFRQVCPPHWMRGSMIFSHLYALFLTPLVCLRFRPDVCIAISLLPHSIFAKIGQLFGGGKFMAWFIGTDLYFQLIRPSWRAVLGPLLRNASCTMTQGNVSGQMLVDFGWSAKRTVVGRNAYDLRQYRPSDGPKEWDLIYTGRFDPEHKRLDILLNAVDLARQELPGLRCALVGDGPQWRDLQKMTDALSLRDHVQFLGHQSDVAAVLRNSKVFIMTSAWEGLPASLVEAFVCGLPAILSPVSDIPDLAIHMENSILIETQDPKDYAEAIVHILTDHVLRKRLACNALITGSAIRDETSGANLSNRWDQALAVAFGPPSR